MKLFRSERTAEIYSLTGYDREGELSFSYVYELSGTPWPYQRIKLTETTEEGIRQAFANPIPSQENEPRALAARALDIADFLVCANLTVYHTIRNGGGGDVLHYGRVLTPALNLFYERDREIKKAASSEPQYAVKGIFATQEDGIAYEGIADGVGPFSTESEAREYIEEHLNEPSGYIAGGGVDCVTEYPPPPYDTTSLCADASRVMGYHPSVTLGTHLKHLYRPPGGEAGYITYPRTDSCLLPEAMRGADFIARVGALKAIPEIAHLVTGNGAADMYYGSGVAMGHGAITITAQPADRERMTPEMFKLYALVAQRTIALTYPPAERLEWSVSTKASGHEFTTRGDETVSKGFLRILPRQGPAPCVKFGDLPAGAAVSASYEPCEAPAEAPTPYTEAGILEAMASCEGGGIGRAASRIALIKSMKSKGYIEADGDSTGSALHITDKGIRAIECLVAEELKSPLLTAEWDRALDGIENLADKDGCSKARWQANQFVAAVERKVRLWCRK
jgi:DNA topoisomerase-3